MDIQNLNALRVISLATSTRAVFVNARSDRNGWAQEECHLTIFRVSSEPLHVPAIGRLCCSLARGVRALACFPCSSPMSRR